MSTIQPQLPTVPSALRHRAPEATSPQGSASSGAAAAVSTAGPDANGADVERSEPPSLDPSRLADRIEGLLVRQVQSGTLTRAQADSLKSAFGRAENAAESGAGGLRPDRPAPGSPPDAGREAASDATTPMATTSGSSTDDLLATFVRQLQSSQGRTNAYGADGARAGEQSASALLLNFKA